MSLERTSKQLEKKPNKKKIDRYEIEKARRRRMKKLIVARDANIIFTFELNRLKLNEKCNDFKIVLKNFFRIDKTTQ